MDQFKSFITEDKHESYRILVISSETSPGKKPLHRTARRFVDEAKKAAVSDEEHLADESSSPQSEDQE